MQFAIALPPWLLLLIAAAIAAVAWGTYAGAIVPLPHRRRGTLIALRALTLLLLVVFLLRPVRIEPPGTASDAVVPVLVDASRSMRLPDGGGGTRIDAAGRLLRDEVLPALADRFQPEVWTFGEALSPAAGDAFSADDGRSDLSAALVALRARHRESALAAVVVISDGGDTGDRDAAAALAGAGVPVHTVGVGTPRVEPDLEVLGISAGEMALTGSSVDLAVTAVSRGSTDPFDLRVLENGRPVDLRRVTPAAAGSPVRAVFTVSPSRDAPTMYTVEIPSAPGEVVAENNRRSVLVEPPARQRRVLVVEGAPGFEHAFIKRALAADEGIQVDSVVRKGRDAAGGATYLVQAAGDRAPRLALGFPDSREALYRYDALVLANLELDALSAQQFQLAADFVGERGGGLLVLGARSFGRRGLAGTALEEVLPTGLADRGTGIVRASAGEASSLTAAVTAEGESHPVTRIGSRPEETAARWRALPGLAATAALGPLRPGARALAIVEAPEGSRPLVAVQRYAMGRSMVFSGEASWRWRMQMPSEDRTHELFWRQAVRWLSAAAPDPVSASVPAVTLPGNAAQVAVDVRDREFAPVADAEVTMQVTQPDGTTRTVAATIAEPREGRYTGAVGTGPSGVYRVRIEAWRGGSLLGAVDRWILAGGADLETADPRLNEDVLRRVARATGGEYLAAADVHRLSALLDDVAPEPPSPRVQDLWHNVWAFVLVLLLLASEWMLRRRWGLR